MSMNLCWYLTILLCVTLWTQGDCWYYSPFKPGIGDRAKCLIDYENYYSMIIMDIAPSSSTSSELMYKVRSPDYYSWQYWVKYERCECEDEYCTGNPVYASPSHHFPRCELSNQALAKVAYNSEGTYTAFVTSSQQCALLDYAGLWNADQRCADECDYAGHCEKQRCVHIKHTWKWFGLWRAPVPECIQEETVSYCGTGVCCRWMNYANGMDWQSHSYDDCAQNRIGGNHHHRCVPRLLPEALQCFCAAISDGYYQHNDIRRACAPCSPGYGRHGCANDNAGRCEKCAEGTFNTDGVGPCKSCSSTDNTVYNDCKGKLGHQLVNCGGDNAGQCEPCPVGTFKDKAGDTCTSCSDEFVQNCQATACLDKTTHTKQINNAQNVEDECHVLTGCGFDRTGTCECNKGYFTLESVASPLNPCEMCSDGKYNPKVSTETECNYCGHLPPLHSNLPRTSFDDCNCDNTQNFIDQRDEQTLTLECVRCAEYEKPLGSKPFKLKGTNKCESCPANFFFDLNDPHQPNQNCSEIPIMKIKCYNVGESNYKYWAIEPSRDSYRIVQSFISEVPDNYYLDESYEVQRCVDLCGDEYKYAAGCGGIQDNTIWIYDHTTQSNVKKKLITYMPADSRDVDCDESKEIQREGNCEPCTACGPNQYNSGCKPGPGSCETCKSSSDCGTNYYLEHERDLGCDDAEAVTDYECVLCKQVLQLGGFWIMQACGNNEFTRWKDDQTLNDTPTPMTCSPASTEASCDVFHSSMQQSPGEQLPYCPPGWFVIKSCFDAHNEWNANCCQRCENILLSPDRKKNPDWHTCTGWEDWDSQHTVSRCEDNYYSNGDSCKLCEMCTGT